MNLQIVVPYQTCPFKCPFCIANDPKVQSTFTDLYSMNKNFYFVELMKAIINNDIKTVVITGDTEPTLNMKWVKEVSDFVKFVDPLISIEIQTKNYNKATLQELALSKIDTIALSADTAEQLYKVNQIALNGKVKRATVILNSEFDPEKADLLGFDQVTFKAIQKGNNPIINAWVDSHQFTKMDKLVELMNIYPEISFRYDENCMLTENRYLIFRQDGGTYRNWADTERC